MDVFFQDCCRGGIKYSCSDLGKRKRKNYDSNRAEAFSVGGEVNFHFMNTKQLYAYYNRKFKQQSDE